MDSPAFSLPRHNFFPVLSCRLSCQTSCCVPPSSGCAAAVLSHLSTALMPFCSMDPLLHCPVESGHGTRSSPSAALRPAPMRTPCLAVSDAAADRRASARTVPPPPSRSRFQTRWYLHHLLNRRRQATVQEPFFRSLTGFLHTLYWRRHHSLHSSSTQTASSHRHRGWTSDLSSFRLSPELLGSPV